MSLTKSELITTLAQQAGVERKTAETMLDCLARLLMNTPAMRFSVPGIGKLVLVAARPGSLRNPKTGEPVQVPAKKALKFRIAKAAKDAILRAGAPQQSCNRPTHRRRRQAISGSPGPDRSLIPPPVLKPPRGANSACCNYWTLSRKQAPAGDNVKRGAQTLTAGASDNCNKAEFAP